LVIFSRAALLWATVPHAVIDAAADYVRACVAARFPAVIVLPGRPAELARAASGLLIGAGGVSWPGRAGRCQMIRQIWVRISNTMSPCRSNRAIASLPCDRLGFRAAAGS
jgi:hypothetical protein